MTLPTSARPCRRGRRARLLSTITVGIGVLITALVVPPGVAAGHETARAVFVPTSVTDATASTDDKSVAVPTGWWTYSNVSEAQVQSYLATNQARLTDIEIFSTTAGVPRLGVSDRLCKGSVLIGGPHGWCDH